MAHYVMGDIHGEADRFHAMLKKIQFSEDDILILLGDVIDRGPDGIALLLEIMEMPNVIMLLGNHEYMMLQYLGPDATGIEIRRWNKKRKCSDPCGISKAEGKGAAEDYCVPAVNSDLPGYRRRWQAVLHGTWLSGG